ncbi:MAG: ArsR/SmtB family transcription factor [Candidatus Hodarchaeales archaeon]|jgi:predicted transcriptional regulator
MNEDRKSLEDAQKSLLQSSSEITAILKAISHPNRFKILTLLFSGPQTFQTFLDELNLKKSALASHLDQLKRNSLVEKMHHGTYKITDDGLSYMQALEAIYDQSEAHKIVQQRYQPAKAFLDRKKAEKESK